MTLGKEVFKQMLDATNDAVEKILKPLGLQECDEHYAWEVMLINQIAQLALVRTTHAIQHHDLPEAKGNAELQSRLQSICNDIYTATDLKLRQAEIKNNTALN